MILVIPAVEEGDLKTEVADNFGRAAYFAFLDTKTDKIKFKENKASQKTSGAGVAAAQFCADNRADIATAYHFGPKAYQALKSAEIEVLDLNVQNTIGEVYNDYQAGSLSEADNNTRGGQK